MSSEVKGSPDWTRQCSVGPQWRTLPNGQIEVEGMGVPLAAAGGYRDDAGFMAKTWAAHADRLQTFADKHGVPVTWALAIMTIESGGKMIPFVSPGVGGLMATMIPAASAGLGRQATKEDLQDEDTSTDAGIGFMKVQANNFGWELPTIAASYNAGSPKCSPVSRCHGYVDGSWTSDGTTADTSMGMVEDCTAGRTSGYALRAVEVNNLAIEQGIGGSVGGSMLNWGLFGLSLVLGYLAADAVL